MEVLQQIRDVWYKGVQHEKYSNCFWNKVGDTHTAVRYCTSWSSRDEDIDALISDIKAL